MFFISFSICAFKLWVQKLSGGGAGSLQTLTLGSEPSMPIYSTVPEEWVFTGSSQWMCGYGTVLGANPDL